jgi:hypothetical protein
MPGSQPIGRIAAYPYLRSPREPLFRYADAKTAAGPNHQALRAERFHVR